MSKPDYNSPNLKDIGGSLLDRIYEMIPTEMKSNLKGQDACLVKNDAVTFLSVG